MVWWKVRLKFTFQAVIERLCNKYVPLDKMEQKTKCYFIVNYFVNISHHKDTVIGNRDLLRIQDRG